MRSLRYALLQRGLRMCRPHCARHCGEAKGTARVAFALQAFADLFSGSAQPWGQGGSTFMLVGAPSNRLQHAHSLIRTHSARARVRTTSSTHKSPHTHTHIDTLTHTLAHTRTHSLTHALTHPHIRVRAVRALSYTANFVSVLAVSTAATACIADLLFSKPRGRSRRTRHTDRLCFEALCLVCAPPASTRNAHCERAGHPVWGYPF